MINNTADSAPRASKRIEGTFDVLGGISTLLAGYSGGITIVREMAQNTDDVPGDDERWLEFHFYPDRLIIKNSTHFREQDFANITTIARGGKRNEQQRTIGAFGVGFVSVYQLTDTPIVRSSGCELRMEPGPEEFPIYKQDCSVTEHTEFELPYRRVQTIVSERLVMPPVTDQWLSDIVRDLPMETYRLLFFLRRLSRIAVFQNGHLLSEVHRTITQTTEAFDQITLTLRHSGEAQQTHTWLRFTDTVPGDVPKRPNGNPAKDSVVHVVVPDSDVPEAFLSDHLSGRLYNYLPTEIETGLPFQINGDFFPSTDRKGIDNDHPNNREWNTRVITAIGQCAAQALPKLLERFKTTPIQLYYRIDVGNARALISPIAAAVIAMARSLCIFSTRSGWRNGTDARWIKPELRQIADQMSPALMPSELQAAAWTFIQKLGVREFTFADVLNIICSDIVPGTVLRDGPSYLQTPAQIDALYHILDGGVAQGNEELVRQTPIFLDHTGRLWRADQCVQSLDEGLRKDLAESGLHFWTSPPERHRFVASLVPMFALTHLWNLLRKQLPHEIGLTDAPAWLNTPTKLYRLYRTIDRTREPVLKKDVEVLPICLDRKQRLCRPGRLLLPDGDRVLYEIFADDDTIPLVASTIYDEKEFRILYSEFGVSSVMIDHVIDRLAKLAREEVPIEQAHPCLNTRDKLLKLYRFLQSKREDISPKHREELRHRLPIWICRDGVLRRAKDQALPPEHADLPPYITLGQVIDIKNTDNLRSFLIDVVDLKPLALEQCILKALIPQYGALDRKCQLDALGFLRRCIETIRTDESLLSALRTTPLILGEDDQLHRPADVCYRDAPCLALFPERFSRLHSFYAEPATPEPGNWQWYEFFRLLSVSSHAPDTVVLNEIKRAVKTTPRQERDRIEKIFRYIEEYWESFYQKTYLASRLRTERWLPADGDDEHWYRPDELYQRQEKPLVSHVAHVLGFTEARRPKQSIADALGFPTSVPIDKVVQQLLKLSERGEPATAYLYSTLSRDTVTEEHLKPLRNRAVIYAGERYWKAEHIFTTDQSSQFGRYRGYVSSGEYARLLDRLNVKKAPVSKDYADLLHEISAGQRDNLSHDDVALIKNAYERLSSADEHILKGLSTKPCVLISTQGTDTHETFVLDYAAHAVLHPLEQFLRMFPELPVARYSPAGEKAVRALGVRPIEDVLSFQYRCAPEHDEPVEITTYFLGLGQAMGRLLYHYGRDVTHELPEINKRLGSMNVYYQSAIDITYTVTLGDKEYTSNDCSADSFYDQQSNRLYLRKGLRKDDVPEELAGVLGIIMSLREGTQALFAALIRDPSNAIKKLDKNNIKPLPAEFNLVLDNQQGLIFGIGTTTEPGQILGPKPPAEPNPVTPGDGEDIHGTDNPKGGSRNEPKDNGTGRPPSEKGKTRDDQEDTPTPPMPPSPPPEPNAPEFVGPTTISSPAIPTDYDGLRQRAHKFAQQHNLPLTVHDPQPVLPTLPRKPRRDTPVEKHDHARFVLSFLETQRGFLALSKQAQSLFPKRPSCVNCHTDNGKRFPLWLDWQRERPIAYNQRELRDFFADHDIPAGGIIYLQREHGSSFRLYYNRVAHVVREVRIAFNEQGEVQYELHDASVNCETDEAIYRAERRFEDQTALWLEAVGKKSVEESLCDLLMSAPGLWVAEDDLKDMLSVERMVAASTVGQTLASKPHFVSDGQGNWRFDPAKLLAVSRDDIVGIWHKATGKLLACDDATLTEASTIVRPPLHELSSRLLRLEEATAPQVLGEFDGVALIQQLNEDPQNTLLSTRIANIIRQRVGTHNVDLAVDPQLRAMLRAADDGVWRTTLRTALRPLIEQLQRDHQYTRAFALAQSWSEHDDDHGLDLARLSAESEAWSLIGTGTPTLEEARRAVDIAPRLAIAHEKLHTAIQGALCRNNPEHYLAGRSQEQAVDAFVEHVSLIADARRLLKGSHQEAFYRTVMQESRHLWKHLGQRGRVRLLLRIERIIDMKSITLNQSEVQTILDAGEQAHGTIAGLLLGLAAWRLCPSGLSLQNRIANHLAQCHIALHIWEKANNQPWKQYVQEKLRKELHDACTREAHSHTRREREILEQLREVDENSAGSTLVEERKELLKRYQRDYEKLLSSAG